MKLITRTSLPMLLCLLLQSGAQAQVSVDVSGYGVKVQTGNGVKVQTGNGTKVQTGKARPADDDDDDDASPIGSNVEIEGVAVVNGQVFIDGVKVPKGTSSYRSKKTGKVYQIRWGKNGNVEVNEK